MLGGKRRERVLQQREYVREREREERSKFGKKKRIGRRKEKLGEKGRKRMLEKREYYLIET